MHGKTITRNEVNSLLIISIFVAIFLQSFLAESIAAGSILNLRFKGFVTFVSAIMFFNLPLIFFLFFVTNIFFKIYLKHKLAFSLLLLLAFNLSWAIVFLLLFPDKDYSVTLILPVGISLFGSGLAFLIFYTLLWSRNRKSAITNIKTIEKKQEATDEKTPSSKIDICSAKHTVGCADFDFDGATASLVVYYARAEEPILCRKFEFPMTLNIEITNFYELSSFEGFEYNTIIETPSIKDGYFEYVGYCGDFGAFKIRSMKVEVTNPEQTKF